MITILRDYSVLLALVALPGAVSWWSGRRVARRIDDPALPELLAAHGRLNGVMLIIAIAGLGSLAPWRLSVLAIPLAFAGLIASAYPLRRVLFEETWSFGSYCFFYPRVIAGVFGFWFVLLAMPALAALAGTWDWLVSAGLAGVLVLWYIHAADVVRFCLRTRPIAHGEFLSRCRALADACGVPQPRFERIDLGGGVIANALAVPSLRTSSVLFTDTMLDRFDHQELLAICAHELAHFEHYNPGYLRRLRIPTCLLIALVAASAPVSRLAGFDPGPAPLVVGLGAILIALVMRARGMQRQETACDLRAVQLTGDADALIRGLTKLYTVARMPRRIEQQKDRSATHPSLARRIRDIRRAAGVAPSVLGGAERFTSADGRTVVVFDDAEVRWVEGEAVAHSLSYAHLIELRVDATPWRGTRLIALGPAARRWEMRLADSDVARLQGVLDVVDGSLGDPPAPRTVPFAIQRMAVVMIAAMVLTLAHVAVAFVALLAALKPSMPLLVGAALAALTTAAFAVRDHAGTTYVTLMALPMTVVGLVLLGFAWGHRRDHPDRMRPFIVLLALTAAVAVAASTLDGLDVVPLHQGARGVPSATVLLAALGGALACSKVRRVRFAAAAVAAAALAMALAGSTAFLDRFSTDPFLVEKPALDWITVRSDAVGVFDVPSGTSRIDLSPNGRYVAAYQGHSDEDRPSTFQVGRAGELLASVTADDVAFVDDDQLLIVQSDSHGTTLKTLRLGASLDVVWQRLLEDVSRPSLSLHRARGRWRVMGRTGDQSIVRAEGIIGTSHVDRRRWRTADTGGGYIDAVTTAGPEILVVEKRYARTLMAYLIPWQWTWVQTLLLPHSYIHASSYVAVSDRGRRPLGESRLDVDCTADVLLDGDMACSVFDGTRTHIVQIDPGSGNVKGIGFLDGHFVSDQNAVPGWLTGWAGARPVAIRLSTGQVIRMAEAAGPASLMSVSGERLAVVMLGEYHSTVRIYPLPPDTRTAGAIRARQTTALPPPVPGGRD
jgi:Zn-dependent protease with chaperone function